MRKVRLAVLQQPLGLFVGGDVLHRADNAADIAIAIHLGRLALVQYPDHLAAAAYQPVFDAVLTGLALEQGTDIVTDRGQIIRMHQCLPLRWIVMQGVIVVTQHVHQLLVEIQCPSATCQSHRPILAPRMAMSSRSWLSAGLFRAFTLGNFRNQPVPAHRLVILQFRRGTPSTQIMRPSGSRMRNSHIHGR
jgi:hypothetical protein